MAIDPKPENVCAVCRVGETTPRPSLEDTLALDMPPTEAYWLCQDCTYWFYTNPFTGELEYT